MMNVLVVQQPAPAFVSDTHAPKLVPLGLEHLPVLRYILARVERSDPYSISPSYFALTGRKGLWIYGDEGRGMLIARHPNDDEILLFFPPFGPNALDLIQSALSDRDFPQGQIQIARLGPEDEVVADFFARQNFHAGIEEKLDWRYDVHVLNVDAVLARKGAAFKDFRKNLNRASGYDLRCEELDIEKHDEVIRALVRAWAENHAGDYSTEDLVMPTCTALYLRKRSSLPIHGIVVSCGGAPVSFILWEETRPEEGLACGLCNASTGSFKGIGEYTHFEMCRVLQRRGYKEVCIGGSEEAGLDRFKRKMAPARSIGLKTISFL